MTDNLPDLGELEREVMQLVWRHGPIGADAIREKLARPLKESTVRTVLVRLEQKGFVSHAVERRSYIYRAVEQRGHVAARAVRRIADWFCNGSLDEVLVGLVDSEMLDQAQLDRLSALIAKEREK
jgi:predicted transcriptional regulator